MWATNPTLRTYMTQQKLTIKENVYICIPFYKNRFLQLSLSIGNKQIPNIHHIVSANRVTASLYLSISVPYFLQCNGLINFLLKFWYYLFYEEMNFWKGLNIFCFFRCNGKTLTLTHTQIHYFSNSFEIFFNV